MAGERWHGYTSGGFAGLENVQAVLGDPLFATSLVHSLFWLGGAALLVTALALALALLAGSSRAAGGTLALLFVPALLPPTVVAAIWTLVYSPLGGLDGALGLLGLGALRGDWLGDPHLALAALFLAWSWSVLGVSTLVLWAGLRSVAPVYGEMARIEGGGTLWRFRHVLLPAIRPHLLLATVINASLSLGVFDLIFVTTGGGPGNATMLLSLDLYDRAFGGHLGQGAAEGTVEVLAGLVLGAIPLLILRGSHSFAEGEEQVGTDVRPFRTIVLALALLLSALPVLTLLPAAVQPGRAFTLGVGGATWDPRTWDGSNVAAAWSSGMGSAILRSGGLGLLCALLVLLLAVPAAHVLVRLALPPVRSVALAALLAALFQPATATIIPLFSLLQSLHLLDTLWGILLPEVARALPFSILLLWGWLLILPPEPLEAAQIDGASPAQTLRYVILPLLRPALAVVALWSFMISWNEYLLPTVVSQDGSLQTVPTLLGTFIGHSDTAFGELAVGTLLAILPPLILFVLLRTPAARALGSTGRGL